MNDSLPLLGPIIALVVWSQVMWLWMYVTRIPAMMAAKMKPDPLAPRGEQMAQLPATVRWKADNYNHLMEQPTVFYAVVLALAMMGATDGTTVWLAWSYVAIRVAHSLVQALVNKIELRFLLFVVSNIPLIALTYEAASLFLR